MALNSFYRSIKISPGARTCLFRCTRCRASCRIFTFAFLHGEGSTSVVKTELMFFPFELLARLPLKANPFKLGGGSLLTRASFDLLLELQLLMYAHTALPLKPGLPVELLLEHFPGLAKQRLIPGLMHGGGPSRSTSSRR